MKKKRINSDLLPPFIYLLTLAVSCTVCAQEPVKRVADFDPSRSLKLFDNLKPPGEGQIEVAGTREITKERMAQIVDYSISQKVNNFDMKGRDRVIKERESMYGPALNNNIVINKINPPITRRESPSIEQYNYALTEGDIGAENLRVLQGLDPSKWGNARLIDKSRTPAPDISWKAFDAPGDCSGDVMLGVSETNVVVTSHTSVGFYDRAGNKLKNIMWIGEFFDWVKASTEVDVFFDTRCLFDPYRKRFWIGTLGHSSLETDNNKKKRIFCCAVSKTQNPMDGWYAYYWYSGYGQKHGHDYPSLGISQDVFIEANTAIDDNGKRYNNVCFFDANSLASGQFKVGWRYWGLKNPDNDVTAEIHMQPLIQHGNAPYTYFLGKQGNHIIVYGIKDPLKPTQSLSSWVLNFSSSPFIKTIAAPQKGSNKKVWFQNLSNWIFSATYRNGNIYFVMSDGKDWKGTKDTLTSIRLVRIRRDGNNYWYDINRVFGNNNKFDDNVNDENHYGFPAIAVNAQGDMVASYCRSGASIYPEIRTSVWRHDGADILPSRLVKAGESFYKVSFVNWQPLPWGDCSGAVVDPVDDHSIWVATSYATSASDNNWGVWVARVNMW